VDGIQGGTKSRYSNVTLFHVKHPVSLQQLLNVGLQGCNHQLATDPADNRQEAAEIRTIQFRCRVVEQQSRTAWTIRLLKLQLRQRQRRCQEFLLAAGYTVFRWNSTNEHGHVRPMGATLCSPQATIPGPAPLHREFQRPVHIPPRLKSEINRHPECCTDLHEGRPQPVDVSLTHRCQAFACGRQICVP